MNIYLDIDGVLITKDGKPAEGVEDFLKKLTDLHDVYWLTTHCQGNTSTVINYLADKLPASAIILIKKIKPTTWQTLKTEAIDFTTDFIWFDDYILESEKNILSKNNSLDKIRIINLRQDSKSLNLLTINFFEKHQ